MYNTYDAPVFSSLGKQQAHIVLFFNENIVCAISLDKKQ